MPTQPFQPLHSSGLAYTYRATSSHLHSLSSPTPLVYLLGLLSTLSSRFGLYFEWVPPTIPITTALALPIDFFSPHTYYSLA
jgi:hypothetical protein